MEPDGAGDGSRHWETWMGPAEDRWCWILVICLAQCVTGSLLSVNPDAQND